MPASISAAAKLLLATGAVVAVMSIASAATAAAATPACVGAAARDARQPCFNPTRSIAPALKDVDRVPESDCAPTRQKPEPVCTFGAPAARARGHIALVGDSHALQWRAALGVVARANRWRGYSITAPGCFLSEAVHALPEGLRAPCVRWYRSVVKWFGEHPEVDTVFVSQNAPTPVDVRPGETYLGVKVAGFRRAWTALPKTVKRVIVIRDTPITSDATVACVRRVVAAKTQRPGPACPMPRSVAVIEDTAVAAVVALGSKRYRFVDLTDFFCNRRNCYPVIGGVLVHRDIDHITVAYSQTLGRYLLRRVRWLMASSR